GGTPIMALALVGMPINVLDHADIARILEGGASVCAEAGAPVAGGHSIDSVEPIYGLAALGLVHPDHIRKYSEVRAGDQLILGKALGVGVLPAALKKDGLAPDQYQAMLHSTTQLNRSGPALAALVGVHAMTDVTGFGLLGHTLELARESGLAAHVRASSLPWLPDVPALARQGLITGASARNWAAYGEAIRLGPSIEDMTRALLCDPQTSGGLLVSCRPDAVDAVLEQFHQDGLTQATVIGEMQPLDSEGDHVVVA